MLRVAGYSKAERETNLMYRQLTRVDKWLWHSQRLCKFNGSLLGDAIIGTNGDRRKRNILDRIDEVLQGGNQWTVADLFELIHDDKSKEAGI